MYVNVNIATMKTVINDDVVRMRACAAAVSGRNVGRVRLKVKGHETKT